MPPDYSEMLSALFAAEVRFLLVGGFAYSWHDRPRFTKDLDLWVEPSADNASRLMQALNAFGAPLQGITEADFAIPGCVLQIGVDPVRIDIITKVSGLDFADAWSRRVAGNFGAVAVQVISREDLIRNKRASGRPQDLADIARLLNHAG